MRQQSILRRVNTPYSCYTMPPCCSPSLNPTRSLMNLEVYNPSARKTVAREKVALNTTIKVTWRELELSKSEIMPGGGGSWGVVYEDIAANSEAERPRCRARSEESPPVRSRWVYFGSIAAGSWRNIFSIKEWPQSGHWQRQTARQAHPATPAEGVVA